MMRRALLVLLALGVTGCATAPRDLPDLPGHIQSMAHLEQKIAARNGCQLRETVPTLRFRQSFVPGVPGRFEYMPALWSEVCHRTGRSIATHMKWRCQASYKDRGMYEEGLKVCDSEEVQRQEIPNWSLWRTEG